MIGSVLRVIVVVTESLISKSTYILTLFSCMKEIRCNNFIETTEMKKKIYKIVSESEIDYILKQFELKIAGVRIREKQHLDKTALKNGSRLGWTSSEIKNSFFLYGAPASY